VVVDVRETFPIIDDVELPAKAVTTRSKKSHEDPVKKPKSASLGTIMESMHHSGKRWGLFSTPSLMKGEDPDVYAELYAQVEEVVQPQDVGIR
jgi:hypothetical protein